MFLFLEIIFGLIKSAFDNKTLTSKQLSRFIDDGIDQCPDKYEDGLGDCLCSKVNGIRFNYKDNNIIECEDIPESDIVHNSVDEEVTIPMVKGLRSINVSSAVALVVGEACRQLKLF